jgi:hypothetical protein
MPEEDFSFWLWSRKWDWLRQRLRKHTLNAPQIEKGKTISCALRFAFRLYCGSTARGHTSLPVPSTDAMQWIRAKKIIWRLQRKCHKMERESLNMVNTRR